MSICHYFTSKAKFNLKKKMPLTVKTCPHAASSKKQTAIGIVNSIYAIMQ